MHNPFRRHRKASRSTSPSVQEPSAQQPPVQEPTPQISDGLAPPSFEESQRHVDQPRSTGSLAPRSDADVHVQEPLPPSFEESQRAARRSYFACVMLHGYDRIRLSNFTQGDVEAVETAARALYRVPGGSQAYGRCREIRIAGASPWTLSYYGEVRARGLLLNIISALAARGWVLQAAFDVTARQGTSRGESPWARETWEMLTDTDRRIADSLYFRKDELAASPPPPCSWIAVSFDQYDALKIVGPVPEGLVEELVREYASLVLSSQVHPDYVAVRFRHRCWTPLGAGEVLTREMMLTLLVCLERFGFAVHSSVGMYRSQEGGENDVLICRRELGGSR